MTINTRYAEKDKFLEPQKISMVFTTIKAAPQPNKGTAVPKNWHDSKKREDYHDKWFPAMEKQIQRLQEKKAWILVNAPKNAIFLNNRWVYDEKFPIGKEAIARARMVVRGDQLEGTDYATEAI